MKVFTKKRATNQGLANRRLVHGIGINDANYSVKITINGKRTVCPFYLKWLSMMTRGYSEQYKLKQKTYTSCDVVKDWHRFSNFRQWMRLQKWEGRHLDKDLIVEGNKTYGPSTCMLIQQSVNKLMNNYSSARGKLPLGVTNRKGGSYQAQISINSRKKHIGYFDTAAQAHRAYCLAKADIIKELIPTLANEDPRLAPALQRWEAKFRNGGAA